jgi:hypothetical protein
MKTVKSKRKFLLLVLLEVLLVILIVLGLLLILSFGIRG